MSVNKYDASTGELTILANGSRMWVGTKSAHDAAKQAGTLPTNCLIAITDDEKDDEYSTDEVLTSKKWIDGKPIYRKVFEFTASTTGANINIGTLSDIGVLINGYGRLLRDNNNQIPIPYVEGSNITSFYI